MFVSSLKLRPNAYPDASQESNTPDNLAIQVGARVRTHLVSWSYRRDSYRRFRRQFAHRSPFHRDIMRTMSMIDGTSRDGASFQYDVCLSFAGENREYVRAVAEHLRKQGVRVFFDEYEQVQLWGKDLFAHLDDIYQNSARFCVLFASTHYAEKVWTNHERQSAQARAISAHAEYILPARFDDTVIPGLRPTVGYVDLRSVTPEDLADLIVEKGGARPRQDYLPPIPDLLFERLGVEDEEDEYLVYSRAHNALLALQRMSSEERDVIFSFFLHACPAELPENVHIDLDLLRRLSGLSPLRIKSVLGQLRSLGIFCSVREEDDASPQHLGHSELLVLEWHDMTEEGGNTTDLVAAMIDGAIIGYCEEHGMEALRRLDFGQLAVVTATDDHHADN